VFLSLRLRNALVLSFFGHLALFSVFSLSFGQRFNKIGFNEVVFLGSILRSDFINTEKLISSYAKTSFPQRRAQISHLRRTFSLTNTIDDSYYLKPQMPAQLSQNKAVFDDRSSANISVAKREKPVITFYPFLPSQFPLYFKDRQVAHIELSFNIISERGKKDIIVVKRKISSGNLEADLLSMRYISRYLFMQRGNFKHNNWQSVKIDLSEKEND